jgi:glycosyltransferase involved in cell wall biosynthesis
MKFSVLMSVYIKEKPKYLDAALKSLVDQTRQPDEIVLVKDGSLTPELDTVVDKYCKLPKIGDRFKVIPLEKNVGLGLALNAGIEACSGEIIARADSDDISTHDRFEKQIAYMETHPEANIISSNIQEYDESMTNKLLMRIVPESDVEIKRYVRRRSPFNHMAVVYRKSIIESVGSYEHCMYFEDYYLWCKVIALGGEFYNFQEPFVHARAGDSMIGRRGGVGYVKNIVHFQRMAKKTGIMSIVDVAINLLIRIPAAIVPTGWRKIVYSRGLRRSV